MSFNPADPMVVLYQPIEQLQKLATAAKIPYSSAQQLELGLTLIRSTRDFEKALGEWNKKVSTTKTWATLKTHFKEAHDELKEIWGPTMQQIGFHHPNMLADCLRGNHQQQGTEMLAMVQELAIVDNNSPIVNVQSLPQPTANSVLQDNVQIEILRFLHEISTERRGG